LLALVEVASAKINKIVMKNDKEVDYKGLAVVIGVPLMVIVTLASLLMGGGDAQAAEAVKREEGAKSQKKKRQ